MPDRGTPAASSGAARNRMRATAQRDTAAELALRRALVQKGLRGYRVNYRPIPGFRRSADIAFTRQKVAVFVDGCFWHGCPMHFANPKSNTEWWAEKLQRNRSRDRETTETLEASGLECGQDLGTSPCGARS